MRFMEQMSSFGDAQFGGMLLQKPNLAVEVVRSLILAPVGWVIASALILVVAKILGGKLE